MSDWETAALEDLSIRITKGTTPSKSMGGFSDFGVNYVKSESITHSGIIDASKFQYISIKNHEKLKRSQLAQDDILFSMAGVHLGKTAMVKEEYLPANTNQAVCLIRIDPCRAHPKFVFYSLRRAEVKHFALNATSQSAQPNINLKDIGSISVPLPAIEDQKAIAHILGTLDDKIEINQKMNQTLEEIAKAIFKSWFVDFDPVRAKAEGRPTGLPPEISDLFPDELVDSEIGEIPKGWEVKTIADLADCVGGATPSTKNPEFWEGGKHTWTSPKDLSGSKSIHLLKTDRKITEAGLKKISSGLLPVGTVLLSSRAPVGYLALTTEPTAINQGYIALKPQSGIYNYFLLHWCESNLDEIKNRASGTTFAEISKAAFRPIPAIEPSNSAMKKFHHFVSPIYERVLAASKEMETLAELRDTLLPKLISGELRIADAEKFLEEAGI